MNITLETNIKQISKNLDMFSRRQVPFASSRALNSIAKQAQEKIIDAIPRIFNTKRRWWSKNQPTGVKISFSNKYHLEAAIYCKAYFAHLQEEGGIKFPVKSSKIAVPARGNVKKSARISGAAASAGSSLFRIKNNLYRRRSKKSSLERVYTLTPSAQIKPRFRFKSTALGILHARFDDVFKKELEYAIRTSFK